MRQAELPREGDGVRLDGGPTGVGRRPTCTVPVLRASGGRSPETCVSHGMRCMTFCAVAPSVLPADPGNLDFGPGLMTMIPL